MRDGLPTRGFWSLMITQSLTVLNDNLFKQIMLLLAVNWQLSGRSDFCTDMQACVGLAFAIPFLLFAGIAGDLADSRRKRSVVLAAKLGEVFVMLGAALAFVTGSLPLLMLVLFLMGMQSAFLGPAKYGALVEMLEPQELARGNGIMQAFLLFAILLGMGSAGLLFDWSEARGEAHQLDRLAQLGLVFAAIAALGFWVARSLPNQAAAQPGRKLRLHPLTPTRDAWRLARQTAGLFPAVLAHAHYWLLGAILVFAWNEMGKQLGYEEGPWTIRLATLSVSIAIGCVVAGRLAQDRVALRIPLLGGLGLALSFLCVAAGPRDANFIWISLVMGSFFAGLYLIPLRTLVQRLPGPEMTGRAIGFSQFCDWVGVICASFVQTALRAADVSPFDSFWVLGLSLLLGSLWMYRSMLRALGPVVQLRRTFTQPSPLTPEAD
jgi:MFS family permease